MQEVTVRELIDITKGTLVSGALDIRIKQFSLDSRTLMPGDMFIAIKGNNFDGHDFVRDSIKKEASGIIVEDRFLLPSLLPNTVIKVKDTIKAIGDIGRLYRSKFKGPLIAVTGTVGKTTTKEFISAVLSEKFSVHRTKGTLNNHIGVPVTLCELEPKHDICILELGMSDLGEIEYLSSISQPDVGIITNIGAAHLEKLSNVENVFKAKSELLKSLRPDGLCVLNRDDSYFMELRNRTRCRLITIGKHYGSDFQAFDITNDNGAGVRFKVVAKPFEDILDIKLPIIGIHNIYPALFAIAIGYGLGMDPSNIIDGLLKVRLPKMRLEIKDIAGMKIIDDSYNANPVSMASALEILNQLQCNGKKIFICSDMLELGTDAPIYHKELGGQVVKYKIDQLVTIGDLSALVSSAAIESGMPKENVRHCKNNIEAVTVLEKWMEPGDIVLVKGSRTRHMEEITKGIEEYYSTLEKLIV